MTLLSGARSASGQSGNPCFQGELANLSCSCATKEPLTRCCCCAVAESSHARQALENKIASFGAISTQMQNWREVWQKVIDRILSCFCMKNRHDRVQRCCCVIARRGRERCCCSGRVSPPAGSNPAVTLSEGQSRAVPAPRHLVAGRSAPQQGQHGNL